MSDLHDQIIALSGVFEAAALVDRLARTGQVPEAPLGCMLGSLLVRDPKTTLDVYGATPPTCARASAPWSAPWSATRTACSASRCATRSR